MHRKTLLFITFIFSTSVLSSTFIPISLDKQMENASGVLRAQFKGVEYKKVSENQIITEATFRIIESVGIKQSEIINKNNFKVIYPGGKWQDLDYRVSGAPHFRASEETLLILKKTSLGYAVKGLGMGKYDIYKKDDVIYYKSSVFPDHASLGKISQKSFDNALIKRFGSALQKVKSDKFVNIPVENKVEMEARGGRFPASLERDPGSESLDHHSEEQSGNPIWIVVIFSLLGAMSVYTIRRTKRRK
ncbi:hypothetical protein [Halobacteriovorax sp. JY17]|uniref:hypothetical protein n=1 Tax=Halobacteriovorax sp. JY17 TaxID=2014617 RepID=UPI000C49683B|nr:hypothetical protein [Halobacteriovorax sp. JY17]PIK14493.1 MAG: hypothetical protein CES88_09110 [Halobacteriovorax sp. JY17]